MHIDMHSGLTISQADPRPMYLQIKEQIRHRIAVGDWKPGQEVPSIRALAIELRVSVITIKRTYAELESEGVIVTQHSRRTCSSRSWTTTSSPRHASRSCWASMNKSWPHACARRSAKRRKNEQRCPDGRHAKREPEIPVLLAR